jgi:hypothetical protein
MLIYHPGLTSCRSLPYLFLWHNQVTALPASQPPANQEFLETLVGPSSPRARDTATAGLTMTILD